MQALIARLVASLKNNPVLLGAASVAAGTLGVTVPANAGWAGLGLAVGEFVVGLVVRHFVSPTSKLLTPAVSVAPGSVQSPPVAHG